MHKSRTRHLEPFSIIEIDCGLYWLGATELQLLNLKSFVDTFLPDITAWYSLDSFIRKGKMSTIEFKDYRLFKTSTCDLIYELNCSDDLSLKLF